MKNVNYAYKATGALDGVGTNIIGSDPNATANVASGYDYRAFSAIQGANYGNGRKLQAGYNQRRSQLASLQVKKTDGTDPIINNEYDYYLGGANNGRIRKITDYMDGNYTTTYGYDEHNRLATASAPTFSRSYSYDAWGNLTNHTASGQGESGSYSLSYATNGTGAPLNNQVNNAGYGYDAAGNLTTEGATSYAYDAANRLKTAGFFNSYEYDGDGNKVKQDNSGDTIYYMWSSVLGEPVVEWTEGEFLHGVYRAYVYGPGGGQVMAMQSYDGQFYWLHTDHLGSGRKLTDASGAVVYRGEFDPHGQSLYEWHATGQTNLNSHKYAGYERDSATNLDNAKARTYHHNRGRFMQPDPLGFGAADETDPQSLNLYSYVGNDPVNFVDPSGLYSICFWHIEERSGFSPDGGTYIVNRPVLVLDGCINIDGPLGASGGGGGGGGGRLVGGGGEPQNPTPTPTPQQKPLHCQPDVIEAMKTAWAQSKNGTTGVEAGFRLDGNTSKYKIQPNAYTNEQKQQKMTISSSTFAIFHVHPTNSGSQPSTPKNNEAGNKEGDTGLVDRLYKQGQHIQIYVMHRYGLTMYDPKSPGQMTKLRDNLEWTKPCPP